MAANILGSGRDKQEIHHSHVARGTAGVIFAGWEQRLRLCCGVIRQRASKSGILARTLPEPSSPNDVYRAAEAR